MRSSFVMGGIKLSQGFQPIWLNDMSDYSGATESPRMLRWRHHVHLASLTESDISVIIDTVDGGDVMMIGIVDIGMLLARRHRFCKASQMPSSSLSNNEDSIVVIDSVEGREINMAGTVDD